MSLAVSPPALLLSLSALLVACGPRSTILTATGAFAHRDVSDFIRHPASDNSQKIELKLSGPGEASLRLTTHPADRSCWLSDGVQHGCTQRSPAGSIDLARFQSSDGTCEVVGWLEQLDTAWQLDLSIEPSEQCDEGRFAATIEP